MSGSNILFIVTGSIAGYKACDAVSRLVRRGHKVRAVMTASARRFIGPATLEGLTGEPVRSELFAPGAALEHVALDRWADAVVVCPATAHTLNRFAAGLADDLVGALFLAHDREKPFLVAPAMNPAMAGHPATLSSVELLRQWGVRFVPMAQGRTACGEIGEGRMAEPAEVVAAIEAALVRPARRLRVLVTSGATAEPIDEVRVLTNLSTGRTGAAIASHLAGRGHEVVLLRASNSVAAAGACREERFESFADLDRALGRLLAAEPFDAIIHAAAVGDFGVRSVLTAGAAHAAGRGKIASESPLTLRLRPQPKLVDGLRSRSANPDIRVIAFKLTAGGGAPEIRDAVESLLAHSGADFVVHNDIKARADGEAFPADVYDRSGLPAARCRTRSELAGALERLLTECFTPTLSPT
jgi:phosphopantothenoylcysteine decarboxylase/phosphopantothenate--cysteine ligase